MKFNDTKQSVADRTRTENFEGGEAFTPESPKLALYKVVINNLLEDTYYRDDEAALTAVRQRFEAVADADPEFVLKLAAYAREELYLRDISQVLLVLAAADDRTKPYVRAYASEVMQRADEPATVLAAWEQLVGGTAPKPLKKGINDALHQWDAYQFAKYDSDRREKNLKDVLNVTHPAPRDDEHAEIFRRLIRGPLDDHPDVEPLETPETWEAVISDRGNTADAWRDVLSRLGLFAKIRNVRNMREAGLSGEEIFGEESMDHVRNAKLYPFRFYQAYQAAQEAGVADAATQDFLSDAIDAASESLPDGLGETFVAVDLSGSMDKPLSDRSSMTYKEIGALFGASLMAKGAVVGGFGNTFQLVQTHHETPTLQRMDAVMSIDREVGNSTNGWKAVDFLTQNGVAPSRIVILTDMQIWDSRGFGMNRSLKSAFDEYREVVGEETALYMIDLSSYGDLVTPEGYENVYNVSGWSEKVLDFIQYAESPGDAIADVEAVEP
jgi:hypothetical protein